MADVAAKTHALDAANRRLQQLTAGMVAEDTSAFCVCLSLKREFCCREWWETKGGNLGGEWGGIDTNLSHEQRRLGPQQAALRSLGKTLRSLAVDNAALLRKLVKEQQQLVALQEQDDQVCSSLSNTFVVNFEENQCIV